MKLKLRDFPKIHSPFIRKEINGDYVVTNEIEEEYSWVFDSDDTVAVEKIHGTCCAVIIENGTVSALFNRTNRIPFIGGTLSKALTEGVNNALKKNRFMLQDGILWGELIGPKIQKNEYNLEEHEWVPFEWLKEHCYYKCWGKYPKTFDSISEWFKELMPLYTCMKGDKEGFVEGIVFTSPDGRMAKLRRSMFDWYSGEQHKGGKNVKRMDYFVFRALSNTWTGTICCFS